MAGGLAKPKENARGRGSCPSAQAQQPRAVIHPTPTGPLGRARGGVAQPMLRKGETPGAGHPTLNRAFLMSPRQVPQSGSLLFATFPRGVLDPPLFTLVQNSVHMWVLLSAAREWGGDPEPGPWP